MPVDNNIAAPLYHSDWMTVVILLSGFFIWSVWRNAGGFLEQRSLEVMHGHNRKSLFASNTVSEFRMGLVLSIVHVLITGLFLHHLAVYFNVGGGLVFYLELCVLILTYHVLKIGIVRYWNYLLGSEDKTSEWLKSYQVFNMILGLLLLPVVVVITYTYKGMETGLNIGIFLLAIYLVVLLVRSVNIFFSNLSSFIYVILYFCVLEILPLMLAVKLALNSG
ncbi:DUF4271 domain-containing protein [Saccharicrinis sp. FJH62]|uniref:DUF4271 domain-containing protein n=1 Tax=Saccharicrinis sp. FJH62 TaxID=3344657 RepID=UPI0035D43D5F